MTRSDAGSGPITREQVINRLEEHGLAYEALTLGQGISIIITQRGGRILGPFVGEVSESVLWVNQAWAARDSFQAFLSSGDWNLGGERFWVAPEIQYHIKDRTDFWGSYELPSVVDPGAYSLERTSPATVRLAQEMRLIAYTLAFGEKQLCVERLIRPVQTPLRHLSRSPRDLLFAGYEQQVTLTEDRHDAIASESWVLAQLNPGGQLYIPSTPEPEYSDYFEPIDANYQTIVPGCIRLRITGDRRYKVGYKAASLFGRLGYHHRLSDGRSYLLVRNFLNDPSLPYVEEPPGQTGCRGHSVHVYNDDGALGGFGELECNGQTIGGESFTSSAVDRMVLWLYVGEIPVIRDAALTLLGVDIESE